MNYFFTLCILSCSLAGVSSFTGLVPRPALGRVGTTTTTSLALAAAKKKGFGSTPEAPKKPKATESPESTVTTAATTTTTATSNTPTTTQPMASSRPANEPNAGQAALAAMRRQRSEAKDAELRKVRAMLEADKQVEQSPAAIPEKVAQRMGQRMLPFVGIPLLGGMACFVAFWYLATYKDMEFQPALVAFSTILILVFSLLGITYSVMSASWDEDREGDFWGFVEFQRNVDNIKEGLGRSRENAVLRERLQSGQVRLEDLEKSAKKETPKTLMEKLKQDGLD